MRWKDVSENWMAFVPNILSRWPDLDGDSVDDVDGDRERFLALLCDQLNMDRVEAEDELAEYLSGEIPSDVIMDPHEDNAQIAASAREIPAGEDPSDDDAEFGDDRTSEAPVGRSA